MNIALLASQAVLEDRIYNCTRAGECTSAILFLAFPFNTYSGAFRLSALLMTDGRKDENGNRVNSNA
jgi:hypothetical protein